ncbi:single-stranded DNA-binding protein (plasmid) [Escherichia coli]|nr:single-stranded DNA-binding protein [Escherichia coli]
MYIPQNFLPRSRQKLLRSAPGQSFPSVAVMPLAAKVLKKVMVNTGGNKRQVPAKRQNRGSRNSTDDGGYRGVYKDGAEICQQQRTRWLYS